MNLRKTGKLPLAVTLTIEVTMIMVGCGLLNPLGSAGNPFIPGTEGQKEVRVQVLDATTMEPIAGAIVVGGYWGISARPGSGAACGNSESAVSDENGWATLPNDQDERIGGKKSKARLWGPELISAYKRGYQLAKPIDRISGDGVKCRIIKIKPKPLMDPYADGDFLSDQIVPCPQNEAQLKTKERSRIYLIPSTAATKDERWSELIQMGWGECVFKLPFAFTTSEGGLTVMKAMYQEMQDIGYPENIMKPLDENIKSREKTYLEFRQNAAKEKLQ